MSEVEYKKNYLRLGLKELAERSQNKPIMFQGIFRSDRSPNYNRFFISNIKLYSEYLSNIGVLTSHVMLDLPNNIADILRDNKRTNKPTRRHVVFMGYIYHYFTDGVRRYGIKLSFDITERPIWLKREKKEYIPMKRFCYHPNFVPFMKKFRVINE